MEGIIFDIQDYAVYDGPGIRTCVFLKGCSLKCRWCHNPESHRQQPQLACTAEKCKPCHSCVAACPLSALRRSSVAVTVEESLCNHCGRCVAACPTRALEIIGETVTPQNVLQRVLRDKPFFDHSGGGVTFTGGEPALQADFLLATLRLFRKECIHTALETCGHFSTRLLRPLIETTDLFLFDLKHADPVRHREFTGAANTQILRNFTELVRLVPDQVVVRIPVIPGFNTSANDVDGLANILRETGYLGPIHLLPYHSFARSKWEKVGRGAAFCDMGNLTPEALDQVRARFAQASFESLVHH